MDAAASAMPRQMRQLFSIILLFNVPTGPLALCENHEACLPEEFINRASRCVPDVQLDEHILNSVDRYSGKPTTAGKVSGFSSMPIQVILHIFLTTAPFQKHE